MNLVDKLLNYTLKRYVSTEVIKSQTTESVYLKPFSTFIVRVSDHFSIRGNKAADLQVISDFLNPKVIVVAYKSKMFTFTSYQTFIRFYKHALFEQDLNRSHIKPRPKVDLSGGLEEAIKNDPALSEGQRSNIIHTLKSAYKKL